MNLDSMNLEQTVAVITLLEEEAERTRQKLRDLDAARRELVGAQHLYENTARQLREGMVGEDE